MSNKLKVAQVAHDSEWALAKFFKALSNPTIEEIIELEAICGITADKIEAIRALTNGITNRLGLIQNGNFNRGDNRKVETESALKLTIALASGEIDYYQVRGNDTLPRKLYSNGIGAVVIHSINPSHLGYIFDAGDHNRHVLCEKPIIPVLDRRAMPTSRNLDLLKKYLAEHPDLVFMDAEHYSHKRASITFYENIEKLLGTRKIKAVEGRVFEVDDPEFTRTKNILRPINETGLMGDVMCHLLAFISNTGARATPLTREYHSYVDPSKGIEYLVDTYNKVRFKIDNLESSYFTKDAEARFEIGKFVDKAVEEGKKDEKYIKFILDDDSAIKLELGGQNRVLIQGSTGEQEYRSDRPPSLCEYVNILSSFHAAINNKRQPRTCFANSIKTIEAIFQAYSLDPKDNKEVQFYKT